jgi:hypothetical protein
LKLKPEINQSFSGLTGTTITGLTVVSQPQLVVQTSSGFTGSRIAMDDSQPVDLASVKKTNMLPAGVAPLKIPAVPLRPLPPRPPM